MMKMCNPIYNKHVHSSRYFFKIDLSYRYYHEESTAYIWLNHISSIAKRNIWDAELTGTIQ